MKISISSIPSIVIFDSKVWRQWNDGVLDWVPMKSDIVNEKGLSIERESMEIISGLLKGREFDEAQRPVVYRVIHATGDPGFEPIIQFHPRAVEEGLRAIREGKDIFVDVRMVEAGISKKFLADFGIQTLCLIDDAEVIEKASKSGQTRAETAVEMAARGQGKGGKRDIGIVAIGNAPTALLKVIELVRAKIFSPNLIVGVPVGFVKAAESKEELMEMDYPFISCKGNKGGSPVAASIVNALLRLA